MMTTDISYITNVLLPSQRFNARALCAKRFLIFQKRLATFESVSRGVIRPSVHEMTPKLRDDTPARTVAGPKRRSREVFIAFIIIIG